MSLAIFVNTSDGFEDCWSPFFTLFCRYGGLLTQLPAYLNTERKNCQWPGLDLACTRVSPAGSTDRMAWGECLLRGLKATREPFVLYLQEDYFLDRPVRGEVILAALARMQADERIGVVYLNQHGPQYHSSLRAGEALDQILPPVRYLVNTQAAIWRKDFLLSLVRPWENAWAFEKFASLRARRMSRLFLNVSAPLPGEGAVIEHVHTGIARGRWQQECVPLFDREGIVCDFSKRGFYRRGSRLKFRVEVLRKLSENPGNAMRSVWSLM